MMLFHRGWGACRRLAVVLALWPALSLAQGAAVNIAYLEGLMPVAPDAVTALGHDLFGDRVNLYNGSLSFEQTDMSLPGNNALPVALVRSHSPGRPHPVRGQFGDWDLEVPRIGGTFSSLQGFVTSSGGSNRCSGFSTPPTVSSASVIGAFGTSKTGNGSISGAGSLQPDPEQPSAIIVGFGSTDYWLGTYLQVPGRGVQEVLVRAAGYARAPADGRPYPLVTHQNWQIGCLPNILNGPGEGFFAISPEGVRYEFNWLASRQQTSARKAGASIGRNDVYLMATRVVDRFGNIVTYSYEPANPLLLRRIDASDGRALVITNSGGRAVSASDGTRTFTYTYGSLGELTAVQQPDGSRWTFNLTPMVLPTYQTLGEGSTCDSPGDIPGDVVTGTITHPSGAVGAFTMSYGLFGRTYVDRVCVPHPNGTSATIGAVYARFYVTQSLTRKAITGPGLSPLNWTYSHVSPGGWSPCAGCSETRTVTIVDPDGKTTRHLFGNRWRANEGLLLQTDEGWNGSSALRTTTFRYRLPAGQAYPEQFGVSLIPNKTDWLSARHRPLDQRVITQQGTSFTWQADVSSGGFDSLLRPLVVRKFSSLGNARTEATTYHDNPTVWVLGQITRVTETTTGREMEWHSYDPSTAMRTASSSFGRLQATYSYNPDGTPASIGDPVGRLTRLSGFRRGQPQLITHRDGSTESQIINNLGLPDSRTNGLGSTTTYGYDTMGRLAAIVHPSGDAASYHPTTQVFEQVGFNEYGLGAGHWRQTVSTGNARTLRFFDALWRERLEVRFDAANPAGTSSWQETRYDLGGRMSFESYPERGFTTVDAPRNGRASVFDALGRVTLQQLNSSLGVLSTTYAYPVNAFQHVVTNPRSFTTVTAFRAFDDPAQAQIVQMVAPEGVNLAISRDVFDKPLTITRSGGGLSVTRSYAYDGFQRLCKTVEPESGATIQDYDAAGNLAWRASGLGSTSLSSCDQASVPASRRISFGYDARDRMTSTTYGDGSPGVTRTYWGDGLPRTIATPSSTWTLTYNNRRLLTSESLATALGTFSFGYGIDSHGHVASMAYPGGPTLAYSPDALGRPTAISGYLSGVSYHPNGQVAGYTAAGAIVHSTTQEVRGLPETMRYSGVLQDVYAYDANGNVSSITDQLQGQNTRSMAYDGLDRLTAANGPWGVGSFSYDALDNLRTSRLGSRVLTHSYDASNRLSGVSGSINAAIGYDAQGNVVLRAGQAFAFDIGNRLNSATNVASHLYDGLGRRSYTHFTSGRTVLRVYGQAGRLLYTQDSLKGATRHIHLGDKLVAESNSLSGNRWIHTDVLGSPVAATNAAGTVLERTRYEPYGSTASGTNPDGVGFTGHVNDPETGLVYMQQRHYDPLAGRFLSVDPVTTDAKAGSSFNRYVYGNNNPYKFRDPDGRAADLALDIAFIAADLVDIGRNGLNLSNGVSLAGNIVGAAIPFATGLGKAASTLARNVEAGKAGEAATRAKLGDNVAGEQVSFKTSDGTRTRTDFVTKDKGVVETKTGDSQLTKGQEKLKADIDAGRPVTPVGQNAANAGLKPNEPTTMSCCTVDRHKRE